MNICIIVITTADNNMNIWIIIINSSSNSSNILNVHNINIVHKCW